MTGLGRQSPDSLSCVRACVRAACVDLSAQPEPVRTCPEDPCASRRGWVGWLAWGLAVRGGSHLLPRRRRLHDVAGALRGALAARAPAGQIRWHRARRHDQIVRRPRHAPALHAPRPTPALRSLGSEWAVNQHRDSHALYVSSDPLSMFFAVAENEAVGRVKFSCLQVAALPSRTHHTHRAHLASRAARRK